MNFQLSELFLIFMLMTMEAAKGYDAAHAVKRMSVKRGARALLPCGGMSYVKIGDFMTWFKGGEVVATYRVDPDMPSPSMLLIKEVKDEDAGTYRCRVISVDGPAKDHLVEVDVIEVDRESPLIPFEGHQGPFREELSLNCRGNVEGCSATPPVNVSIRTDNNDNFEAGSPRVLACIVYGCVPSLNVTWYLGNTMLRPNVYKEVNRGNFTVSSLTFVPSLTDNGKDLVCKATNRLITESFEDRVTVSVGHRPMCIDDGFKTIGAVQGDSETLVCMVESDPEPEQFIWSFADGRTVYTSSKKVSGHRTRYSSTLVWVPRVDDYGPLYCRGSNRFGEQKQPCTFSVIGGGPPNMPECDIYWEDQETLRVKCDKNWDGGRPQTIHLEVKTPKGTRKVSRKGNELKVNSLRRDANYTIELYATNSRGRSLSLQVALPPPPPAFLPPERPYTSVQATWVVIMTYFLYALGILLFFSCCFGYFYSSCRSVCCDQALQDDDDVEGSFHREEEMAEVPCAERVVPNKKELHGSFADTESPPCVDFECAGYKVPMHQPDCLEYDIDEIPPIPTRCLSQACTPMKQRTVRKSKMPIEHYYV